MNTGWTGGPYGTGKRMRLKYTRAMIAAAINGELILGTHHEHAQLMQVPHRLRLITYLIQVHRADRDSYDEKAANLVWELVKDQKNMPDTGIHSLLTPGSWHLIG